MSSENIDVRHAHCSHCRTAFEYEGREWPAGIEPDECADCGGWPGHSVNKENTLTHE